MRDEINEHQRSLFPRLRSQRMPDKEREAASCIFRVGHSGRRELHDEQTSRVAYEATDEALPEMFLGPTDQSPGQKPSEDNLRASPASVGRR
jgi:hypothetical protein